ncbi:MAG: short-chain dehydrogenase, partial [Mycobacterium sp.]
MKRLDRHRILVTGAASGIGQATALRLLDEGAS